MTITAPKCKLCGQQHWGPLCAGMAKVKGKKAGKLDPAILAMVKKRVDKVIGGMVEDAANEMMTNPSRGMRPGKGLLSKPKVAGRKRKG